MKGKEANSLFVDINYFVSEMFSKYFVHFTVGLYHGNSMMDPLKKKWFV